ncbi:MAG: cysteine--tRNA ligase [Acidimicrobiia bacterium]|nr:cysteine--tRNA ligase [Acidimicrobiia bacterium]
MIRLYDTARGEVVPLEPRDPGKVSMYVCGPTVYGPAHLGHGRFALVFDVLRRYLEWSGLEVTYVSNITDIDDKIIDRAAREGRAHDEVAREWEAAWWRSMEAIGVARPTHDPHATAFVAEMVALIERLIAEGAAYETDDGVYFSAEAVTDYGLLARQSIESLQAGARVEVDETKRSPVDFALWKKAKPEEPSWPSPWGPGRPGWHTECVVMSLGLLGDGFDIHGGGQDLAFPHHENERAQARALGHRFAAHWVHNGFVEVGGEKMSKSLGNFTDLDDLAARSDPRSYRLLVLRSHYRSPIEVNEGVAADASAALRRLDALARRAATWPTVPADAATLERFRERMDDDLDTPAVVDLMFRTLHRANQAADEGRVDEAAAAGAAVMEMTGAVGLELLADTGDVPAEVAALARQRDEARTARDWAAADALRDAIVAAGYVVEDTAEGTSVRPG